jgi:membrane protease YdiL (CAAX protease family)
LSTTIGERGRDVAALAGVLAYSVVLNRRLPRRAHIPGNLAAAAAATALAHAAGASWDELGFGRTHIRNGVRLGLKLAVPIVAGVAGAASLPSTRRYFAEQAAPDASNPAFEVVVRIPFGTALCEEVIFRSALLAWFERSRPRGEATLLSSLCFGLWHVLPTLDAQAARQRSAERGRVPAAVVYTVAVTSIAGSGFVALRRRSGSVVAPLLVHAALNASAFAAGHWARAISPT